MSSLILFALQCTLRPSALVCAHTKPPGAPVLNDPSCPHPLFDFLTFIRRYNACLFGFGFPATFFKANSNCLVCHYSQSSSAQSVAAPAAVIHNPTLGPVLTPANVVSLNLHQQTSPSLSLRRLERTSSSSTLPSLSRSVFITSQQQRH